MTAPVYTPQGPWADYPDTSTPITAAKLTGFDDGISAATGRANAAYTLAGEAIPGSAKGAPSGVATLDANSKIPSSQLPTKPPAVFYVADYNAVGDGSTDDTAAINACITAAVSAAQAAGGPNFAVVQFDAKTYLVNGPLTQGGDTKGNAILPLPIIADTINKVTLVFKGAGDASALPHWNQTVGQKAGTVLKTTVAASNDGTFGEACVLGGPNVNQGYGKLATYSNMLVVIDGISISVPNNPAISGFDFCGVAEANIVSGSCFVDSGPADIIAPTVANQWTFGLRMPFVGNNANNNVFLWSCEGMCYGLIISELSVVFSARCVYCVAGLVMTGGSNSTTPHRATVFFATVQWCIVSFESIGTTSPLKVDIWMLDIETAGGDITGPTGFGMFKLINDESNCLQGKVYIDAGGVNGVNPDYIQGATGMAIYASNQPRGAVTAPAVPASGTAQQNRFLRDAAVYVAGGTVTDIAVDGASIGVTSGLVMVPAGKNITLTYSAAPTWAWTLL